MGGDEGEEGVEEMSGGVEKKDVERRRRRGSCYCNEDDVVVMMLIRSQVTESQFIHSHTCKVCVSTNTVSTSYSYQG